MLEYPKDLQKHVDVIEPSILGLIILIGQDKGNRIYKSELKPYVQNLSPSFILHAYQHNVWTLLLCICNVHELGNPSRTCWVVTSDNEVLLSDTQGLVPKLRVTLFLHLPCNEGEGPKHKLSAML